MDGKKRICRRCKKEFVLNRSKGNKGYQCNSCATAIKGIRAKERALKYKGCKCQICGYDECTEALEFHHLNPQQKQMNFNTAIMGKYKWDTIKQELDKCILVCSNCHRELHYHEGLEEKYEKIINEQKQQKKLHKPETYELFIKELNKDYENMSKKYNVSINTLKRWENSYGM